MGSSMVSKWFPPPIGNTHGMNQLNPFPPTPHSTTPHPPTPPPQPSIWATALAGGVALQLLLPLQGVQVLSGRKTRTPKRGSRPSAGRLQIQADHCHLGWECSKKYMVRVQYIPRPVSQATREQTRNPKTGGGEEGGELFSCQRGVFLRFLVCRGKKTSTR